MSQKDTGNPWDKFEQEDKRELIEKGLRKYGRSKKKKVIIVGAGMAGLVAAYELSRAKVEVTVLEAQHRVGGRVWTLREPFTDGLYAEAGAMRLPESHILTRKYVEKAKLGHKLSPFNMICNNALCCFNGGEPLRFEEYYAAPERLKFEIQLRSQLENQRLHRRGKRDKQGELIRPFEDDPDQNTSDRGLWRYRTSEELWQDVMRSIKKKYLDKNMKPKWEELAKAFDHVSTRDFLEKGGATSGREDRSQGEVLFDPWTPEEIHMYGLVENQQARFNNSVLALLREWIESPLDENVKYEYLEGGMDQLPNWFLSKLKNQIRFGASVETVKQMSDGSIEVGFRNAAQKTETLEAQYVIFAVPFTILRHIDGVNKFSSKKRRAIQALNYSAAGKIFLQCRNRFWENNLYPINGGRSQTDLAIRSVWYPQHGQKTGRGILLASYTWGRDAERWGHLTEADRIRRAIEQLNELHRNRSGDKFIIKDDIVEVGTSVMWQNHPFAGGAFALFNPHQERLHREPIRDVEGLGTGEKRIHFAGEHTCPEYHRWIEGAVDSGLRTAWEVNEAR